MFGFGRVEPMAEKWSYKILDVRMGSSFDKITLSSVNEASSFCGCLGISVEYTVYRSGESMFPWGTPALTG